MQTDVLIGKSNLSGWRWNLCHEYLFIVFMHIYLFICLYVCDFPPCSGRRMLQWQDVPIVDPGIAWDW